MHGVPSYQFIVYQLLLHVTNCSLLQVSMGADEGSTEDEGQGNAEEDEVDLIKRRLFEAYDADGNGVLHKKEVKQALRALAGRYIMPKSRRSIKKSNWVRWSTREHGIHTLEVDLSLEQSW